MLIPVRLCWDRGGKYLSSWAGALTDKLKNSGETEVGREGRQERTPPPSTLAGNSKSHVDIEHEGWLSRHDAAVVRRLSQVKTKGVTE